MVFPNRGPRRPACRRWAALLSIALLASALASPAVADPRANAGTIKVATWNLEWLIAPAAFKSLKETCAPRGTPVRGDVRRLPCDVAGRFERSSRDFSVLARYARQLDADVVALQEVDGPQAARLVFEDHEFCFTSRRHVQNTGFAIRRGLPHRCGTDVRGIAAGDSLRRGAELIVFPGTPGEIRLLSVHLKSGCTAKSLASSDKACRDLARQMPALEAWIDAQARVNRRFLVLGDFNRDLLADERNRALGGTRGLWPELDDGDPPESDLQIAAEGTAFRNCAPGQRHRAYIDHIVLSRTAATDVVQGSFQRLTYTAADARRAKLSDHCPVAIRLRAGPDDLAR